VAMERPSGRLHASQDNGDEAARACRCLAETQGPPGPAESCR